jgi:hypothetical protein
MTPEQRDKYYQRKYGITLAEYEKLLALGDGGCWICSWKPQEHHNRLAVDHDHKIEKTPVKAFRVLTGWRAYASEIFKTPELHANRADAVKEVKRQLLRRSVRGLVCWNCNSLLKKAKDCWETLNHAARYIARFEDQGTPVGNSNLTKDHITYKVEL